MAKPSSSLSAFDVLMDAAPLTPAPVYALVGSEGFLKHETRRALIARLTEPGHASDGVDVLAGTAPLRDVLDALGARSLFGGGRRIVVVEDADVLVKNYREQLEDYVGRPFADTTLVLEVASWPSNTRLAKAVAAAGLAIACQTPDRGAELTAFERQLKKWLIVVAKREFQCELQPAGVDLLVDLLPSEPGVMYQEVGRLALRAGGAITPDVVRQNVGGWRTRQTWDMIDAAADGRAADALGQLDRLLAAGEEPFALLPQMASTLRRFAAAVRMFERAEQRKQPLTLRAALQQAGVLPFKLGDAERQLRQIGRPRARELGRWLLAADLDLKGHNSGKAAARRVIETLILRLSREAASESAPRAMARGSAR